MTRKKGKDTVAENISEVEEVEETEATGSDKPKVAKEMRAVYNEVARLSATLAMARRACYDNKPGVAVKALNLLGRQIEMAAEVAELSADAAE